MTMLFCTNKNEFTHQDKYNGVEYVFPPGQKVELSEDAARHMFGLGEKNTDDTLTRLGWAMKYDPKERTFTENPDGIRRLANFVFSKAVLIEQPLKEDKTLHLKK